MVGALLFAIFLGAIVVLLVYKLAMAWQTHRERKLFLARLRQVTGPGGAASEFSDDLFRQDSQQLGSLWQVLQRATLLRNSEHLLEQAGLDWGPKRLTQLSLAGALLGLATGYLLGGSAHAPLGAFAGLVLGGSAPSLYVRRVRAKRWRTIEEQLPDAVDLLGRAIRAGHGLGTGFRLVAEESPEPIASEFRRTFEEQKYGMPFEESLLSMTRRMGLIDVRVLVVAILIQREVGGNLAEVLDKLANLVRARFALRRQLMVYTAQGRLSGYVLSFLPLVLGGVISLVNPGYVQVLFQDPLGKMMLGMAFGLQLVGYFWIWRILKLDL